MAKYLWSVNYTQQGIQGLLAEGGTSRFHTVKQIVEKAGGKLESFYYAFGEYDGFLIVDLPDPITASAIALTVAAAGAAKIQTTVLITPADVDEVMKKKIDYRAPGK